MAGLDAAQTKYLLRPRDYFRTQTRRPPRLTSRSREGNEEEQAENDRSVECQSFGAGVRRSLAAIFTRSGREPAFILRIT